MIYPLCSTIEKGKKDKPRTKAERRVITLGLFLSRMTIFVNEKTDSGHVKHFG